MHWIKVVSPKYDQSRNYRGCVGEVVGRWGPDNSTEGRDGFLVEFEDGEIVGVTEEEVQTVDDPGARPPAARGPGGCTR